MGDFKHIEYSSHNTFQRYPKIMNKIGDIITVKMKHDGENVKKTAEIVAFYKHYVLLMIDGKYRTTIHNSDFCKCSGANVSWEKLERV